MTAVQIILNVLMIIASIIMIATVLMQSSDDDGMSALTGGNSESYMSKNKNAAADAKLALITKISAAAFVVLAVLMLIV